MLIRAGHFLGPEATFLKAVRILPPELSSPRGSGVPSSMPTARASLGVHQGELRDSDEGEVNLNPKPYIRNPIPCTLHRPCPPRVYPSGVPP